MSAPVAPIGWPSEMPEPFGLTFAGSRPSAFDTAHACAANASFASITSRSATVMPARSSSLFVACTGPMPMYAGSTPACAYETRRARGFAPRLSATPRSISTTAAAASLMPDALPAVTVPFSLANTGLSFVKSSSDASWRTCSSASNTTVPLRDAISIGRI